MWPSYRLHYMSCPSVCLSVYLSVRLSVPVSVSCGLLARKTYQNWYRLSPGQTKRSKAKVIGRQKPLQQSGVVFTYGQPIDRPLLRFRLQGGRGLGFPLQASRTSYQLQGRPHTMSAPTSLLIILLFAVHCLLLHLCCASYFCFGCDLKSIMQVSC